MASTQWRLKFKFIDPIHHFIRVGSLFKTNLAALICSTRPPYARNPSITWKKKQKIQPSSEKKDKFFNDATIVI